LRKHSKNRTVRTLGEATPRQLRTRKERKAAFEAWVEKRNREIEQSKTPPPIHE